MKCGPAGLHGDIVPGPDIVGYKNIMIIMKFFTAFYYIKKPE